MKTINLLLAGIGLLWATSAAGQSRQEIFASLEQLSGSWLMKKGDFHIKETWQKTHDSLMEGKTFRLRDGNWLLMETVQLVLQQDTIRYVAAIVDQNSGQPVSFVLVNKEKDKYVFENKAHDFPQQIIYHFLDADHLHAAINGHTDKDFRVVDFNFEREKE